MSFFFRNSSNTTPTNVNQISETDRLRGKHINSILRVGAQAITRDQSTFDVALRLQDNRTIFIRIVLPERFPVDPPIIQLTSPARHAWLDSQMRVIGHPDLNNWNAHSDLGRIVSEIMKEFSRNSPVVGAVEHVRPDSSKSNSQQFSSHSVLTANKERHQTQTPSIPAVFPELENLSASQLTEFLDNPAIQEEYLNKMQSVKNLKALHEQLISGNIELAKKNLELEPTVRDYQEKISQQKALLNEANLRVSKMQIKQQKLAQNLEPRILVGKVAKSADVSDTTSEDIANNFVNGEMDLQLFLQEYLDKRSIYHLRKLKVAAFSSN